MIREWWRRNAPWWWPWPVKPSADYEAYQQAWLEWSRSLDWKPTDTPDTFPSFENWKQDQR